MKKVPIIALCTLVIVNCGIAAKMCIRPASSIGEVYGATGPATWQASGAAAGTISGESLCLAYGDNSAVNPANPGELCWCRMTSPRTGPWVYSHNGSYGWAGDPTKNCNVVCAEVCAWKTSSVNGSLAAAITGLW